MGFKPHLGALGEVFENLGFENLGFVEVLSRFFSLIWGVSIF